MGNTTNNKNTIKTFKITEDNRLILNLYGITPEIERVLERMRTKTGKGRQSVIDELLTLTIKYPHIPQIKNLLTEEYRVKGDLDKAFSLNRLIVAEHPQYLFARINLASQYISNDELDQALEILGTNFDLHSFCPERNEFHIGEFVAYYQVVFNYLLQTENLEILEARFEMFKEVTAKFDWIKENDLISIEKNILQLQLLIQSKKYFKERDNLRLIQPRIEQVVPNSKIRPVYNHNEVLDLYEYQFEIDKEILQNILKLPRKTLIEDLHTMIHDSIARFEYFKENDDDEDGWGIFLIHAMHLLAELKSYESLPILLNTMRQDEAYCDFYFGDTQTEFVWSSIMALGENQLDALLQYLFEPYRYTFSRSVVVTAVTQFAINFPSRRDEVIAWFDKLIKNILAHEKDDSIIDVDWIGFVLCDALDLKAPQLLPQIKLLYDKDLVNEQIIGDYTSVVKEISGDCKPKALPYFDNIFDFYDNIEKNWTTVNNDNSNSSYNDDDDYYDEEEEEKPQPAVNPNKSINRNDPCPCGSGKKYKKCCGK